MTTPPIRTAIEYKAALRELSGYFDNEPEPDSESGHRFERLIELVEAYEASHAA